MALFLMYRFGPTLLLWGYVGVSWLLAVHWSAWRTGHVFTTANENVVAVAVTLIFAVMILVATGRLRWLRWKGLTVLGALTYPLYLTHSQVVLPLLKHTYPGLNRYAALVLAIAVSLAVAYAVYRLVEKPGQAWMRTKLRASLIPIRAADGAGPAGGGKGRDDEASVPVPQPRAADGQAPGQQSELVRP
jgi:peptidoglycan/LPS O-acetylase OafA/YrhL